MRIYINTEYWPEHSFKIHFCQAFHSFDSVALFAVLFVVKILKVNNETIPSGQHS